MSQELSKIFDTVTANGMREMTKERFIQAVGEVHKPLTDEIALDLILRKFHGHTKEQWKNELVKRYPYIELPHLVKMAWYTAQGRDYFDY